MVLSMDYKVIFGFIFAVILFIVAFYVWYKTCFVEGYVQKWRDEVIRAHQKSNSILKKDSILFNPILFKVVTTLVMLGGLLAVSLGLRDFIIEISK